MIPSTHLLPARVVTTKMYWVEGRGHGDSGRGWRSYHVTLRTFFSFGFFMLNCSFSFSVFKPHPAGPSFELGRGSTREVDGGPGVHSSGLWKPPGSPFPVWAGVRPDARSRGGSLLEANYGTLGGLCTSLSVSFHLPPYTHPLTDGI